MSRSRRSSSIQPSVGIVYRRTIADTARGFGAGTGASPATESGRGKYARRRAARREQAVLQ